MKAFRHRSTLCCCLCFLACFSPPSIAEDADEAAIEAAARDYIEGWFSGDAQRMEKALSPFLAKRIVASELDVKGVDLVETPALRLIRQTDRQEPKEVRVDVQLLDHFQNAASVRIDAGEWIDYLHLAKIRGEWKIVNVLWERKE